MKTYVAVLLCGMLLLCLPFQAFAASVTAADRVSLTAGQTQVQITLTVDNDGPYAGAEFGLQCADGVEVESVRFENASGSVTVPIDGREGYCPTGETHKSWKQREQRLCSDWLVLLRHRRAV